jgi:5-methylcytosine-specific restriction endonuclease McrA
MGEMAFVECGKLGNAITIFKNHKQFNTRLLPEGHYVIRIDRSEAVKDIRYQVLQRQKGKCLKCDGDISWNTMHMDEDVDRGKGGLISLDNCRGLCSDCHVGPRGKHGLDRSPRWSK